VSHVASAMRSGRTVAVSLLSLDRGTMAGAVPTPCAVRAVIVDTDTGIDDAQALVLLLRHPGVRVLALTLSHGNVALSYVEGNACAAAAVVGRGDVPVFLGASTPLMGKRDGEDASFWHGVDGLGNTGFGAEAPRGQVKRDMVASDAIGYVALQHWEETGDTVDIITLGPLTNLALAVRLHPRLLSAVGRVFVMGGAYTARGNTTMAGESEMVILMDEGGWMARQTSYCVPWSHAACAGEYNVVSDPEAAAIVFATFPDIVMVSWELTLRHCLPPAFVHDKYLTKGTSVSRWLSAVSQHLITVSGAAFHTQGLAIPDPLAAAVACRPGIITRSMRKRVVVELSGKYTRGMTVVDWMRGDDEGGNVEIVEEVDEAVLHDMLLASVAEVAVTP